MGLRSLLTIFVVQALLWQGLSAKSIRTRRDSSITVDNNPNKKDVVLYSASSPSEVKAYHPPLLAAPPAATAPRTAGQQQGYQPPLLLAQSNDYKPLISSSQTQSVRYQAPGNSAQLQSIPVNYANPQSSGHAPQGYNAPQGYGAPQGYSAPLLASAQTGNLNTLPLQQGSRQGFAYTGDHGSSNQFSHQPAAPAESQPAPAAVSTNGDGKNDEYVVYYYYYYDNDTSSNGSSNFDDIPSLESYDTDKSAKEPEKSASARTLAADVNSLTVNGQENKRNQDSGSLSQPRSASSGNPNQPPFIRSDKPPSVPEELTVQPLKPISNVFRYGSNEVPRFPILPNFVVSETPTVTKGVNSLTSDSAPDIVPTTEIPGNIVGPAPSAQSLPNPDLENDDINDVDDQPTNSKAEEDKIVEEPTTTTTMEPPTTTEVPTTTTERSRRRPGTGNRRRFNPGPSFSSNRRQNPTRSSSSTSTTTTTTSAPGAVSTRGSFRGGANRVRSRPTVSSNRPRPAFSRNAPSTNDNEDIKSTTSTSSVTTSTTTTARPRFGGSSQTSSRRFSSTRTRSQPNGATRSTTTSTTAPPRPRTAPRPRPNLISRSRPQRPGLFRSRTPSEPEEPETTTTTPEIATEEESLPSSPDESSSPEDNETLDDSDEEEEETSDTETEAPTTTEKSRFSALFRPRNRSTLNRPRPPVGRRR